ncbi:DUF805 domain-containing protein [Anaerobiospirillum sp. NML120449]|uniref:DUF805 domain-containing protein n=1 Tax=Anaerobiospirillum sp. NML120449 TaxID=2932817 RepID=UPI001FF394C9|nr:DUF805 domain-containing protein [Anaerobiospirillum sp. NML120449]MCK0527235.1 DUF805 domain-containing protein [Anaerobiospirillum sp. NML120449]
MYHRINLARLSLFTNLFNIRGRASKYEYHAIVTAFLFYLIFCEFLVSQLILIEGIPELIRMAYFYHTYVIHAISLWFILAIFTATIRRLHDSNKSILWLLIPIIAAPSSFVFVIFSLPLAAEQSEILKYLSTPYIGEFLTTGYNSYICLGISLYINLVFLYVIFGSDSTDSSNRYGDIPLEALVIVEPEPNVFSEMEPYSKERATYDFNSETYNAQKDNNDPFNDELNRRAMEQHIYNQHLKNIRLQQELEETKAELANKKRMEAYYAYEDARKRNNPYGY